MQKEYNAARDHEKKQVTPILEYRRIIASHGRKSGIFLDNKGFGPARLTDLLIYNDKRFIGAFDSRECARDILRRLDLNYTHVQFNAVAGIATILPGETFDVIYFSGESNEYHGTGYVNQEQKLRNIDIVFRYCSIYDDCETGSSASDLSSPEVGCGVEELGDWVIGQGVFASSESNEPDM